MISYEFYKIFHLFSLIAVIMCLTANTLLPVPKKWSKIAGMIANLLLFVAGMGLLARMGFTHGESWPVWVKLKILIWFVLAVGGPILMKRLPTKRPYVLAGGGGLLMVAVFLVIFRPF